jgi:oxygen-independent coproporphyrinogen-3 oxidase
VIALQPDHLSAYSLQIEERTALLRWVQTGRVSKPDDDSVATMYELTHDRLAQAGFVHYEISNWARDNAPQVDHTSRLTSHASRHNLVYWRNEPYLGFGCGAHSSFGSERYSNVLHPREYIARIQQTGTAVVEDEPIDRALEMGETMMLGLRLIEEGVTRARFADRFGVELDDVYGTTIAQLITQGLLESAAGRVRLTPQGRLLGNRVFGEFLPDAA